MLDAWPSSGGEGRDFDLLIALVLQLLQDDAGEETDAAAAAAAAAADAVVEEADVQGTDAEHAGAEDFGAGACAAVECSAAVAVELLLHAAVHRVAYRPPALVPCGSER